MELPVKCFTMAKRQGQLGRESFKVGLVRFIRPNYPSDVSHSPISLRGVTWATGDYKGKYLRGYEGGMLGV